MAERRPNRTLGAPHHVAFWAYCNKGELRLQKCDKCGHVSWPAVTACDNCDAADLSWQAVSGRGRIISWGTFERQYYKELPPPWDVILVKLEEGPLFMSNPKGFTYKDIDTGMPVKVAFIDAEDGAGEFKIPVFERA